MFRILPIIGLLYLLIRMQWLIGRRWLLWTVRALLTVFFAIGVWVLTVHRAGDVDVNSAPFQFAAWSGLGMFGYVAMVLLILIPIDLVLLLIWGVNRIVRRKPLIDPTRRAFVRDTMGVALLGVPAVANLIGVVQGATGPRLQEIDVPIRDLPPELDGLKIAQISDLHVSPTILRPYVERVVELAMSAKPDLIALTGDLVDAAVARIPEHVQPMERLSAPLGVYYVTGNHEYYAGEPAWSAHWVSVGFTHLTNEHRLVRKGAVELAIAGVPDNSAPTFGDPAPDPRASIRGAETARFKLLLAHRPDACFGAADAGFDLQLSGHTHAGQFHPWSLYVPLAHPYTRGLNRHTEKLWVYVSPGTGYWGPPSRFGVPSEVTLLRLKRV